MSIHPSTMHTCSNKTLIVIVKECLMVIIITQSINDTRELYTVVLCSNKLSYARDIWRIFCKCFNKTSNYVFKIRWLTRHYFLWLIHYVSQGRGPGCPKPHTRACALRRIFTTLEIPASNSRKFSQVAVILAEQASNIKDGATRVN